MNLTGKKVLVYGYSISGKAAVKLLKNAGARVFVYDDGKIPFGLAEGVCLISDLHSAIGEIDALILSPSVRADNPEVLYAISLNKIVISELELGSLYCDAELIAITGTNGKTTTTLLISEILNRSGKSAFALGNIGIALSDKASELTAEDYAVVEASSFQLESVKDFSPDVSVILNIAPDHLDRHGTMDNYIEIKSRIFKRQSPSDAAVFNADNVSVLNLATKNPCESYFFSKKTRVRGCYIEKGVMFFEDTKKTAICSKSEIMLSGEHNLENALAAATVCMIVGVEPEIIRMVLKTFTLPEYRNEYLGEKFGKRFYNDSKGTNTAATLAAINAVEGKSLLIMGGSDKGEDFGNFFGKLPKKVEHILVTGDNASKIINAALDYGFYNVSYRATLEDCVTESLLFSVKNVIFSPGSASFDKYSDYKQRGQAFTKCYIELK